MKKIIAISLLMASCYTRTAFNFKLKPTNNKGGYVISILKDKLLHDKDSAVVYGFVREIEHNKPLINSRIKIGCYSIDIDNNGFYHFKERIMDEIYLTSSWIGYKTVETESFKLERGDSIRVDFFLASDDRPLINCEKDD